MSNNVLKRFLNFTEIQTKITSLFTFLMTIAFMMYKDYLINWELTIVFFVAMFLFDLTTTGINNYIDTKTNLQPLAFARKTALGIILVLLSISSVLGAYLAWRTDLVVFLVGGLCFLCGIMYTFGPVPISRMPLGEIFSGFFYGFMIPFLLLYMNLPKGTFLDYTLKWTGADLHVNFWPFIVVGLLSVIPMAVTANIMLANNICDVESDTKTKRFTLAYYLGKHALTLFGLIYYAVYLDLVVMVVLGILSPLCLIGIMTLYPVQKNIKLFHARQIKRETFVLSIKNFILIMGSVTLLIYMSSLFSL